jgi:hypothetical protein
MINFGARTLPPYHRLAMFAACFRFPSSGGLLIPLNVEEVSNG